MALVAVVLVAAVVVGLAGGGSASRLADLPLRGRGLVVAAVGVQAASVAAGGVPGAPAGALWAAGLAVSAVLVAAFLAGARGVAGLGLVALGFALNALVVAANGAMPVSAAAAARAGVDGALGAGPRHEPLDGRTRLPLLSDVVPVPLPGVPEVASAGDVLVAAGVARFVVLGMRGPRRPGRAAVAPSRPVRRPSRPGRPRTGPGGRHGEEGPQAARPQEERCEPRQAPQRLTADPP